MLLIPSLILGADPGGISVTSDPWGTKPWGSTDRSISSRWRTHIRSAKFSIKISWRMQLPENRFDGVFANASLFHVLSQELPRVLLELYKTLKPRGVLFKSERE